MNFIDIKMHCTTITNFLTCFHFQSQYIFNYSVENSHYLVVKLIPLKFCNISTSMNAVSIERFFFLGAGWCTCSYVDLYNVGGHFESQPGHRLFWQFSSPVHPCKCRDTTSTGPQRFPSISVPLYYSSYHLTLYNLRHVTVMI